MMLVSATTPTWNEFLRHVEKLVGSGLKLYESERLATPPPEELLAAWTNATSVDKKPSYSGTDYSGTI